MMLALPMLVTQSFVVRRQPQTQERKDFEALEVAIW